MSYGTLVNRERRSGSTGDFDTLTIDTGRGERRYNVFSNSPLASKLDELKVGDSVSFETIQRTRGDKTYYNLVSIEKATGDAPSPARTFDRSAPRGPDKREKRITKMNALDRGVSIAISTMKKGEEPVEVLRRGIALAEAAYSWIMDDAAPGAVDGDASGDTVNEEG